MIALSVLFLSASADAGPFDHTHAAFAQFLSGAVGDTGVDYTALQGRRSSLDGYLASVRDADTAGWSDAQRLALYVNAYNAYTIALILDSSLPSSITTLDGGKVWDTRKFTVAGQPLTLNQMEHGFARKLADGRVHSVLNCASKGCPPLYRAPIVASDLDAQLDAAARRWASTNAMRISGNTVEISMIFDWYGEDFSSRGDIPGVEGEPEAALWFLSEYVDGSTRERLLSGALKPAWASYDWSLNKK